MRGRNHIADCHYVVSAYNLRTTIDDDGRWDCPYTHLQYPHNINNELYLQSRSGSVKATPPSASTGGHVVSTTSYTFDATATAQLALQPTSTTPLNTRHETHASPSSSSSRGIIQSDWIRWIVGHEGHATPRSSQQLTWQCSLPKRTPLCWQWRICNNCTCTNLFRNCFCYKFR